MNAIILKIKEAYDFGSQYFQGEINGQSFKIRMNKDHKRNSARNDDSEIHNLSLINCYCPDGVVRRECNDKIQNQEHNVTDWEKAEELILDFLFEIERNY